MMKPEKIKDVMSRTIQRQSLIRAIAAADICGKANALLLKECRAKSYKNHIVTIVCTTPVAAANIRLMQQDFLKKLNEQLPKPIVTKVRFRIGVLD